MIEDIRIQNLEDYSPVLNGFGPGEYDVSNILIVDESLKIGKTYTFEVYNDAKLESWIIDDSSVISTINNFQFNSDGKYLYKVYTFNTIGYWDIPGTLSFDILFSPIDIEGDGESNRVSYEYKNIIGTFDPTGMGYLQNYFVIESITEVSDKSISTNQSYDLETKVSYKTEKERSILTIDYTDWFNKGVLDRISSVSLTNPDDSSDAIFFDESSSIWNDNNMGYLNINFWNFIFKKGC